ncbi:MAG TPA: zinc ribbon domain-containing protein [Candidatus Acidoferrales bacterium]|nr:zinc ribbon domain-containing protein [Candidatus Acidoferrales bacterium]
MPTYEYKCDNCGFLFEEFQSMSDEPIKNCPKCQGKVQRLISAGAGMIFKGSGFYLTDYKKSNSSPSKSNNGTESHKSEAATKSKTETPASAKTEKQTK